jgi:hypothetical protein
MISVVPKNKPSISSLFSNPIFHSWKSATCCCSSFPILMHSSPKLKSESVNYNK